MHRIDTPGSVAGRFSEGNPYGSPAEGGTVLGADFMTDLQENVCRAIEGAGIELEKGNETQLLEAIQRISLERSFRGREIRGQTRVGSTSLDLFGCAAPTESGTATQGTSTDGPYLQRETITPSSTPEDIGWEFPFTMVRRYWEPDLEVGFEFGFASNCRVWVGLFSASPEALQDPSSISCAGFRFDYSIDSTGAGGDGAWKSCTSNGAASTIKSTGVAVVAADLVKLRVRRSLTSNARFEFYIDGILVSSHDFADGENVPAAGTPLGLVVALRHLSDTQSKTVRLYWFVLRSK